MSKLKTLKDLERDKEIDKEPFTTKLVYSVDLKKEAIKWVKELELGDKREKVLKLGEYSFYEDKWEARELFAIQEWIKHFFNITEEDLK